VVVVVVVGRTVVVVVVGRTVVVVVVGRTVVVVVGRGRTVVVVGAVVVVGVKMSGLNGLGVGFKIGAGGSSDSRSVLLELRPLRSVVSVTVTSSTLESVSIVGSGASDCTSTTGSSIVVSDVASSTSSVVSMGSGTPVVSSGAASSLSGSVVAARVSLSSIVAPPDCHGATNITIAPIHKVMVTAMNGHFHHHLWSRRYNRHSPLPLGRAIGHLPFVEPSRVEHERSRT
jgi:hypothetical protein